VLIDLQARIPETATRVRQRLDAVFEDAVNEARHTPYFSFAGARPVFDIALPASA
jgi:hypothetical protein